MTHELLGTIKGANAEVDMLKAALVDMTAQRDARMDMSSLAAMGAGSGMSVADVEEFQTLKVTARNARNRTSLQGAAGNHWRVLVVVYRKRFTCGQFLASVGNRLSNLRRGCRRLTIPHHSAEALGRRRLTIELGGPHAPGCSAIALRRVRLRISRRKRNFRRRRLPP